MTRPLTLAFALAMLAGPALAQSCNTGHWKALIGHGYPPRTGMWVPDCECDDGTADIYQQVGGGMMAARAPRRTQPVDRAGIDRCSGAPAAQSAVQRR